MTLDPTKVRVGRTGAVYVAPLGSTLPASIADTVVAAAPYVDLGYLNDNGVDWDEKFDVSEIKAWQNSDVVRSKVSSTHEFKLTVIETNPAVIGVRFRSNLTSDGAGGVTVDIGSLGDDRRVYVFDVLDEDDTPFARYVVAEAQVTDAETISHTDSDDPVAYGMTFTAYRPAGGGQIVKPYWSASAIGFS